MFESKKSNFEIKNLAVNFIKKNYEVNQYILDATNRIMLNNQVLVAGKSSTLFKYITKNSRISLIKLLTKNIY